MWVQAAAGGTCVEEQGLVVSPLGREPLGRAVKLEGNWVVADPQLDISHHLPPSCVLEIWFHKEIPAQPSPGVGTAWLLLGSPVQAVQAYWEGSADLVVGRDREGSLGEGEDAAWCRSACEGRNLENQGHFS